MPSLNDKTLGQVGYEAYGDTANWVTFDGRPMPSWEALTSDAGMETRRRWEVSAVAIAVAHTDRTFSSEPAR